MIKLQQLSGGYRRQSVFGPIDLSIATGGIVALLGGNGSGKTTLLKTLLGLSPPMTGEVYWNDRPLQSIPLAERARLVAFVPQHHKAGFGLRVLDIVAMGGQAGVIRSSNKQAIERAQTALNQLKQGHLANKRVTELSGGQQQLVLIARALAQQTPVLVLDEPVNHLDWGHQQRLLDLIADLADSQRTIIFSTHHPDHARRVANRCILLKDGHLFADGCCKQNLTHDHLNNLYQLDF
jgi:iron complex transport system ATP-binding protein